MVSDFGSIGISTEVLMTLLSIDKLKLSEYHPKVLEIMNMLAEFYITQGKLKNAETFTHQVFELSREHFGENNFYELSALNTLSKIRRAEENFADALVIDEQALQITEKVCGKISSERLTTLDAIADDHAGIGNFTKAIEIREQILSEYEEILEDGDPNILLKIMTKLAKDYIAMERYTDAEELCDKALANQESHLYADDHISLENNIMNLFRIKATLQKASGDNARAAMNYKQLIQAYEIKRNAPENKLIATNKNKSQWFAEIIPIYRNAADTAQEVGDMNFAFYCMEFCKGRNLIDRYDDILVSKSWLLRPNEREKLVAYQKSLNDCLKAYELVTKKNNDVLISNIETIYSVLSIKDSNFKNTLREKYSNNMVPKDQQKRAAIEQKPSQWEEALKNFDLNKNRQAIPDNACLIEFMKISDESLLIMFLRNDGDVQATNIPVDKDFFDNCRLYYELNSYADINALHSDGKYLWQIGDNKYIITAKRAKPSSSAVSINDSAKWDDLRKELAGKLSQKIIPSLKTFASNSSHWIISPDAELNLLPFETFIYHDKMLIESVDVSYVPSLAVLNLMKKRAIKNAYLGQSKELFAMGDAVYGNGKSATSHDSKLPEFFIKLLDKIKGFFSISDNNNDLSISRGSQLEFFDKLRSKSDETPDMTSLRWNDLPGTARELDNVSTLFENKDIYRKGQVTESNLQNLNHNYELSKYKYLLFATHGFFVPDMPEISSIVLSQNFDDDNTDGYITVREWMEYDLRSDLVYLSACESGLGGYQAGEGIVGIPYALTVAGNKDTVMSLWKVDDEATAEFTSAVFKKLSRGQSEVTALNETKREFIKKSNTKYNNPSIWAAFLLYGI